MRTILEVIFMSFFYKPGVDICSDKSMFDFLKNHFTYDAFGTWSDEQVIAANVKLHALDLSGDWHNALSLLEADNYEHVCFLIDEWCRKNPNYRIHFNGNSSGYLVLSNKHNYNNDPVITLVVNECADYEGYKRYCKEFYGSVKARRAELREAVQLVQSFDRLCDQLRDYVEQLSVNTKFETYAMEAAVYRFNNTYANDLEKLGFSELVVDADGFVNLFEVITLQCLTEAFLRLADYSKYGYNTIFVDTYRVKLGSAY
jgi:hypothetical protein